MQERNASVNLWMNYAVYPINLIGRFSHIRIVVAFRKHV